MISTIVNILLAIISYILNNHKTTNKTQEKVNKLVKDNVHLLDEVTKQEIASKTKDVEDKVNSTINDVSNADSLQQSNDSINKLIGKGK